MNGSKKLRRITKAPWRCSGVAKSRCLILVVYNTAEALESWEDTMLRKRDPMSVKVTIHQLQDQLQDLLERTVQSGEECVVQRDGKDYAVIVSARAWRRRTVGRRLDALGPAYGLAHEKQMRTEELLAKNQEGRLTRAERRELNALLRECEDIMLRRAKALDSLL
jgi:antitoxin (DNA-binding transcriptional repressor) of toxin-antitoxin stability system